MLNMGSQHIGLSPEPDYAAAMEHNLPVAMHPGSEGVGVSYAPTAARAFPSELVPRVMSETARELYHLPEANRHAA